MVVRGSVAPNEGSVGFGVCVLPTILPIAPECSPVEETVAGRGQPPKEPLYTWTVCTHIVLCAPILCCVLPHCAMCTNIVLCAPLLDCVHLYCAVCSHIVLCAPTLCCVHPYWTVCSHIVLCESLLDCVHPYFVVCIQVVLCAPLLDSVHPHSIFAPMVVLLCGPISYLLRRIKQILSNQTY